MFLNPNIFFNMNSICSNLLGMRNLQWSQNFCKFLALSLEFQKFSLINRTFFPTVGQNNFDNQIPILLFSREQKILQMSHLILVDNWTNFCQNVKLQCAMQKFILHTPCHFVQFALIKEVPIYFKFNFFTFFSLQSKSGM